MVRRVYSISIILSCLLLVGLVPSNPGFDEKTPVSEVQGYLGASRADHYPKDFSDENINRGKEIVHFGKTTSPDGKKSTYVSKYYVCTSCHNTVREDPDLTKIDQEARLTYAEQNNLPYLQASTFWGITNRTSWYNDDYVKKYGDLVRKATNSLEESTQLCATVCSQGRALSPWEMDAVKAYYWSLQMTLGDLELSGSDWEKIKADDFGKQNAKESLDWLNTKFLHKSPATFTDPPEDKKQGYQQTGRPEKGAIIYKNGCQHCHRPNGESDVVLDNSKHTFKWLNRHKTDHTQLSIYEIVRHGTYAESGHKEYMPHYTLEKMSHQQVEDLRAYIEQQAGI